VSSSKNAEDTQAALLEEINPFLAKLLTSYLPSDTAATATAKALAGNVSDIEASLRTRMEETMRAATRVLEAVERGRSGGQNAATIDGDECLNAPKEPQLAALNNLLRTENNRLRDLNLQDAIKVKELQNNLADKEEELLVAQRKIVQLREDADAMVLVREGAAATAAEMAPPESLSDKKQPFVGVPPNGVAATPQQQTAEGIERLKQQLERRGAEVEDRDVALSKAER